MSRLLLFIVSFLQAAYLHESGICHAFLVSVAEDQDLEVIANPHGRAGGNVCSTGTGMMLDQLLEPYQLIVTPMATQPDTFQDLSYTNVLTVPVPVYNMKQPARISAAELEFQLVLAKELGLGSTSATAIQEVPYPMEQARDSWFPGYYWTPLVMSCGNTGEDAASSSWQHVGWKFTAVPDTDQSSTVNRINRQSYPYFYALMVHLDETKTKEGVRVGGFKAPGWMVGAVLNTM